MAFSRKDAHGESHLPPIEVRVLRSYQFEAFTAAAVGSWVLFDAEEAVRSGYRITRKVISISMRILRTITGVFSVFCSLLAPGLAAGETLYNGIVLPSTWPPQAKSLTRDVMPVPYLDNPPAVIPIDVGRQLLVDDYLIEETTLKSTFHRARYHPASPVIRPESDKPWEFGGDIGTAITFSDGVWYDPQDNLFKMWYWGGRHPATTCYATSKDGIHWKKPVLGVRTGTNVVNEQDRDSATVWLDHLERDPRRRFKMGLYAMGEYEGPAGLRLYFSPDGISWSDIVASSGPCGDRTTFFYNPFRSVWVYSIRGYVSVRATPPGPGRCRLYREHSDLVQGASWKPGEPTFWVGTDRLDEPGDRTELYTLDCAPYESLMIGLFSIMRSGRPKLNDLVVGYSRDGFHWHRPDRQPLIGLSEKQGDWNWAYLQSAGACCLVVGDELFFYVGARSNELGNPDAYRSTGLAILRRDGFVSLDAAETEGTLTTRPVRFSGKHLFVNADVDGGQLRVEVLDQRGEVVSPFTFANCEPIRADTTLQQVMWQGAADLGALAGQPVRFRFSLENGALYAFWVSPDRSGASHGYVAAGGPGLTGPTDTVGRPVHNNRSRGRW